MEWSAVVNRHGLAVVEKVELHKAFFFGFQFVEEMAEFGFHRMMVLGWD